MNSLDLEELLTRRVDAIYPSKSALLARLKTGKKLTLYQGFDPSKPNLHLGHLVGLLQLKLFQDLGHQVIFLIGDFTGMIGDPTDKSSTRPKLTRTQVKQNARTYQDQAGRVLNFSGPNAAQIKFNSAWLDKLSFAQVMELSSYFTVQQFLERDMFQNRLKHNQPIYLHEFLYPLMVTYDALTMAVDLEIGGTDQMFNMTIGRSLIKDRLKKDKFALTLKLLTDAQGKKIGKTTGNAINLFGHQNDLFGQIMALPDDAIINTFTLATALPLEEIKSLQKLTAAEPLVAKKRLAYELVKLLHGHPKAQAAQAYFENTFQRRRNPVTAAPVKVKAGPTNLLSLLQQAQPDLSSATLKRVVREGGVEYNGKKITDPAASLTPKTGDTLKYGKYTYRKIVLERKG